MLGAQKRLRCRLNPICDSQGTPHPRSIFIVSRDERSLQASTGFEQVQYHRPLLPTAIPASPGTLLLGNAARGFYPGNHGVMPSVWTLFGAAYGVGYRRIDRDCRSKLLPLKRRGLLFHSHPSPVRTGRRPFNGSSYMLIFGMAASRGHLGPLPMWS